MRPALVAAALALATPALAAPPPGHLTGRVLGADGAPVARFTVNGAAFSGGRGYQVLLPIGDSRLVFRAEGYAPTVVLVHATARGTSGRRFVLPDLVLGQGAELIGEVVDAETGDPVVAARAALAGPDDYSAIEAALPERLSDAGSTGNGGAFLLRRAARGRALLVVSHPDYLPATVVVETRGRLPIVQLQRGGVLEGLAHDASGRPIPNARVVAVSESAGDAQEVRADAKGAFRMVRLHPGTYTVVASGALAGTAVSGPVVVRDGQETRLELAVAPSASRGAMAAR